MKEKERKYLADHAYYNEMLSINTQYTLSSPYVDTTVLRTPESLLKGIYHSKYNRFLSEEYLLNFRVDNRNFGFAMGISRFTNRDALLTFASKKTYGNFDEAIKLPKPRHVKTAISAVIGNRRSLRAFSGFMTIQDLSTVLLYTCGVTGSMHLTQPEKDAEDIYLRSQPSGGGLYPIALYIVVWNVKGLKRGIYEYYPYRHSIRMIKDDIDIETLQNLAGFGEMIIEHASFCFAYVYQLYVNSHKYGDAGMAYALIEAGEMAMGAQLCATALGCGGCDIGGYNKHFIERLLSVDGLSEQVIHFTVFGKGE